jgi:hypothetical protein
MMPNLKKLISEMYCVGSGRRDWQHWAVRVSCQTATEYSSSEPLLYQKTIPVSLELVSSLLGGINAQILAGLPEHPNQEGTTFGDDGTFTLSIQIGVVKKTLQGFRHGEWRASVLNLLDRIDMVL